MKRCTRCGENQPLNLFGKDSRNTDGLRSWCKPCLKKYQQERQSTPEYKAERAAKLREKRKDPAFREKEKSRRDKWSNKKSGYDKQYRSSVTGRAKIMWNAAKRRASDKSESFNLSLERVERALSIGICEHSGIQFDLDTSNRGNLARNPRSPSIDKSDPFKPYSDDNVNIVCNWYNQAKGQLSELELIEYCKQLLNVNGYEVK